MTGILLVSHPGIAGAILEQARVIVGKELVGMAAFEVGSGQGRVELSARLSEMDDGEGLLVLVDLPGATPANLIEKAGRRHEGRLCLVTGLNLPMAIRAWNYRDRSLDELADIAAEGGRRSVTVNHG